MHEWSRFSYNMTKWNIFYLNQGILFCDDACASIEEKKIYRGRSEGVFVIDSEGGLIVRNKIFENNDGIVLFNAKKIEISENEIMNNVRSGCLIGAKMFENQVKENKFIGIMFRDGSKW